MQTRLQTRQSTQENFFPGHQTKRKAVDAPAADETMHTANKRSAFGDLTNALRNVQISSTKKSNLPVFHKKSTQTAVESVKSTTKGGKNRSLGRVDEIIHQDDKNYSSLPNSQEIPSPDSSSLSDTTSSQIGSTKLARSQSTVCLLRENQENVQEFDEETAKYDYDQENQFDPFNVPHYARDIFDYYRQRESTFAVGDYLHQQNGITKQMRAILVDWMVEVQENFELNHETLYQAVKMTDLYLYKSVKESVSKQTLQLVGTTALFISSKFDERCPPASDDFLYICDDAYSRKELLDMEREILKCLDFDIGYPLSYRFLRRYSKVSKMDMETLTLARYILEMSLMFYEFVQQPESLMAAGCLLLARRMKKEGDWTPIHRKYSGYAEADVEPIMWELHRALKSAPATFKNMHNIRTKYSHEIFYKVAEIPLLSEELVCSDGEEKMC